MVWDEIFKYYEISPDEMEEYVKDGYIQVTKTPEGQEDYNQNDIEQTGLVGTLLNAGFGHEDAKRYLTLEKKPNMKDVQLRMLRRQRYKLLEEIHRLQKLLDQIDFMAWNKEHHQ